MNTKFLKLTLLALVLFTASCSNDDNETVVAETETVSNLEAPSTASGYTKFSFSKNAVVTTDDWDIAFRGTTILVNGGVKGSDATEPARTGQGAVSIVSDIFANVTTVPANETFKQDTATLYAIPTGGGNGWYTYNVVGLHIIAPIAGKVFVVKTHDGKYAKFEVLSYYKDAPAEPNYMTSVAGYYKFNFAYQANSNTTF
ncbi:HmuY family protein [Flavobacterium seoulense]|uniref:HmuY protein n=1 Tax=Flavobacterium seoulense TaxID=1492738 RepID=A0A066WYQ2_9FLAO|nr:HmuY family protein [Flavobacterium seoulense]KDN56054.1 hypothetical protein FEM21_06060 [Flavobacterium seoulense]